MVDRLRPRRLSDPEQHSSSQSFLDQRRREQQTVKPISDQSRLERARRLEQIRLEQIYDGYIIENVEIGLEEIPTKDLKRVLKLETEKQQECIKKDNYYKTEIDNFTELLTKTRSISENFDGDTVTLLDGVNQFNKALEAFLEKQDPNSYSFMKAQEFASQPMNEDSELRNRLDEALAAFQDQQETLIGEMNKNAQWLSMYEKYTEVLSKVITKRQAEQGDTSHTPKYPYSETSASKEFRSIEESLQDCIDDYTAKIIEGVKYNLYIINTQDIYDIEMRLVDIKYPPLNTRATLEEEQLQIELKKCRLSQKEIIKQLDIIVQGDLADVTIREACDIKGNLADTKRNLADTKGNLADTKRNLADTKRNLADTKRNLADTKRNLADTKRNLADTKRNLADTKRNLADTKRNLADTKRNLADTKRNLADTKRNLADTKRNLADTKRNLADTKRNLADTKRNLADTKRNLADMQFYGLQIEHLIYKKKSLINNLDKKEAYLKEIILQGIKKKHENEMDLIENLQTQAVLKNASQNLISETSPENTESSQGQPQPSEELRRHRKQLPEFREHERRPTSPLLQSLRRRHSYGGGDSTPSTTMYGEQAYREQELKFQQELQSILDKAVPKLPPDAREALDRINSYHRGEANEEQYIDSVKQALKTLSPETWIAYEERGIVNFVTDKKKKLEHPKAKKNDNDQWELHLPARSANCKYPNAIILHCIDAISTVDWKDKKDIPADPAGRAKLITSAFLTNMRLGKDYGWSTEGYQLAQQYEKHHYEGIHEAFKNGSITINTSPRELRQIGTEYAYNKLLEYATPMDDNVSIYLNTMPGGYFEELARFKEMKRTIEIEGPIGLDLNSMKTSPAIEITKEEGNKTVLKVNEPVKVGTDDFDILAAFLEAREKEGGDKEENKAKLKIVITPDYEIWVLPYHFTPEGEKSHHSLVAWGKPCIWAGEGQLEDSILKLECGSGHFKLYPNSTTKEFLMKILTSAFLNKGIEIIGTSGNERADSTASVGSS